MKFILPIQKADSLLDGFKYNDTTWENKFAMWAVIAQTVIGGGSLAWFWRSLPPKIPFWYSKPWGEERLGPPYLLLIPILSALMVYAINRTMIAKNAQNHPMFARALSICSLFVSILSGMIVIRILTLIS